MNMRLNRRILTKCLLFILSTGTFLFSIFFQVQAQNNQIIANGQSTTAVNFPGPTCIYTWVNSNPAIGLPASGTGNINSFTATNSTGGTISGTITATPLTGGYAYIAGLSGDNVAVVNTANNQVVATIPVGIAPEGVSVSPDGSTVYVGNFSSGTVSVINAATNQVTATITVGTDPQGVVVSPDGSRVYVANSDNTANSVSVINTATNTVIKTIQVGLNPRGIAISPDGSRVYVANNTSNTVSVINTINNTVVATVSAGANPAGIAVSPDGKFVYTANQTSNDVSVISATNNQLIKSIPAMGTGPFGVAVSSDGSHLYTANLNSSTVSVINISSGSVNTIPVGNAPNGVALSEDGKLLYVPSAFPGEVSIINTATNTVISTLSLPTTPNTLGNFVKAGNGCGNTPITFSITVTPTTAPASISAGVVTGSISACAGSASASPDIQQFAVSATGLTGNITATAPVGFQISLAQGSGYGSNLTLTQSGGAVSNKIIYVRSSASASGNISGNVVLASSGATSQNVAVRGTVNALPVVNAISDQNVSNNAPTAAVNFTGAASTYTWTNDQPGIGLPASGTGNIGSFTAVNKGSTAITANVRVTPVFAGYAYIANANSNTVSKINTTTNKVEATIPVGTYPWGECLSPDGSKLYVTNKSSNTVSVVNTVTNAITATISVGSFPSEVRVSPDGTRVYITNVIDGSVSVIDGTSNMLITSIFTGGSPEGLTVSRDGKHVYVADGGGNSVSVINTATNTVISTLASPSAFNVALNLDGSLLYVSNSSAASTDVSVFNTATNAKITTITVGLGPQGLAASPDGSRIYVSNYYGNTVSVINTTTNTSVATIPVDNGPSGISVSPDGSRVYVTSLTVNEVTVVNTVGNAIITKIPVGFSPYSFGDFVSGTVSCPGTPVSFKITVAPTATASKITAGAVSGNIFSCAGSPSASPNIQQFTVSASGLMGNITASAPAGFQVSLASGSGYANNVTVTEVNGNVSGTVVYVRSTASAAGNILGNVVLASAGNASQNVAVDGIVYALPTVGAVPSQIVASGQPTTAVNFSGTANAVTWTNDNPTIGLAASGVGDITSFNAINTGTANTIANITATPVSAGIAYIANEASNNVYVVNTLTNKLITTIPVQGDPIGVSVSPDGSRVYVTNNASFTVSVINAITNSVITNIPVGNNPNGIVVSPDGRRVYVANTESGTVSVINTSTNAVVSVIPAGNKPQAVAISPDGTQLFVTNNQSNDVYVIETATNTLVNTINVGIAPAAICISPDGSRAYVANFASNTISVINTKSDLVIATVNAGQSPWAICISPDGGSVYFSDQNSNDVRVIKTSINAVTATISVGTNPFGLSLTPDGSLLYVANENSNNVSVISTASNTVINTFAAGLVPTSFGNFIKGGASCTGTPVTFSITVRPSAVSPVINAGIVTGSIITCEGTASASPDLQQFSVSAINLTGDITATAPAGFELSLTPGGGYSTSLAINGPGGAVSNVIVYVRAAAASPPGNTSGNIVLSAAGIASQNVPVNATISPLPTINQPLSQTVANGMATAAINFTGSGSNYTWTNDTPGIGLAAGGTGNIASFTAVNTTVNDITATITVTPAPTTPSYAYIANQADGTVSVIDIATNQIAAVITVGSSPSRVSVSADGTRVYVANSGSNNVSVIDTKINTVVATLSVGTQPFGVSITPDGSLLYVTNESSASVSVVNTATNSIIATIAVGSFPYTVLLNPSGTRAYVVNNGDATVTVINTADNSVAATIPVGSSPIGLTVSPDGSRVYVANSNLGGTGTVSVIDAQTNKVISVIAVGLDAYGMAVSPDGSRLYVTNSGSNSVSVINTATNTVVSTIAPAGAKSLTGISVTPDGSRLYVVSYLNNNVLVINTATNAVIATVTVGSEPLSFGNFITNSIGCSGMPVSFTIKVTAGATPVVITTQGTPAAVSTVYGTPSSSTSFTVAGAVLTAGILVTAPAGFEVSTDNIIFSNTVTLGSAGTLAATPVYIRLAAATPVGSYSGNIVLTTAGATAVNVAMPNSIVTKAPLTVTANNQTKYYGAANPVLTVSYSGFVNGDDATKLTTQPVASTVATTTFPVGDYPINVDGGTSPNYTFNYVAGVLTITAGPQKIFIPNAFTPNNDGINDRWDIKNIEGYPNNTVTVFNRYGEQVFACTNYSTPWDGRRGGADLPAGTYYYIVDPRDGHGVISGFVVIIR